MVLSIVERIKGFLFSPSETFDASKEDTLGDALKYFVIILAIYAVLSAIIVALAISMLSGLLGMFGVPAMPFGAAMGPALAVSVFIGLLVGGIVGIFIGGVWLHLWVYLMGGTGIRECKDVFAHTATTDGTRAAMLKSIRR
jgi:hypothetical protein